MKPTLFPDVIGQDVAKRKLNFFLDGYRASNYVPHLMFVAPKGCGKTTMAKATAKELTLRDNPSKTKPFLELNCSTIKNVSQFFNQIVIPHVNFQECTILFDEASELPKDVTMALLTILNPNKDNRNSFSFEEYTVDFDFTMQSFMFATTEAQSIFHALMDRCERLDLEEYTYDELGRIVAVNYPEGEFEKDLLGEIATVLRGNARQAQKMANNIKAYLASKKRDKFTAADWAALKYALGILPLGLSRIELQVLRILSKSKECSLTNLSAKTGLTPECLRRDFEMYLQKHSLMEITTNGRTITSAGQKYLKELDAESKTSRKTIRIKLPHEVKDAG
jgi:Holliday junction resolvasome RuvABC ATP-dependent DNA helicase subunit